MNIQGTLITNNKSSTMPTLTATEARRNFSEMFNRAHYGGGILIENHGKRVAVVPLEVLDRLAELEALIDRHDATTALDEFQKMGGITLDELEKELSDE